MVRLTLEDGLGGEKEKGGTCGGEEGRETETYPGKMPFEESRRVHILGQRLGQRLVGINEVKSFKEVKSSHHQARLLLNIL